MTRAGIYDAEKWYKIKDARLLAEFIALSSFGVTPTASPSPRDLFRASDRTDCNLQSFANEMPAIKSCKVSETCKKCAWREETRKALRRGFPHFSAPIFHGSHVQQVIPEIKNEFPLPTDEAIKIPFKINYLK